MEPEHNNKMQRKRDRESNNATEILSDSENESEEEFEKEIKEPPVSLEIADWTNAKTRHCGFDTNESAILDDDEKLRVKTLMKPYCAPIEPDELDYHELAYLLNRAFVASFYIPFLRDFVKASQANDNLAFLPYFSRFTAWWETRDTKPPSRTCSKSGDSRNGSDGGWDSRSLVVRPAPTTEAPSASTSDRASQVLLLENWLKP